MAGHLRRIVLFAARRPAAVVGVTLLATVVAAVLALGLQPSSGTDTLVGRTSGPYQATQRLYDRFGGDAVIVLARDKVTDLTLTSDLARLIGLEGCIAGNVPAGVTPRGGADGPCGRLSKTQPAKVVIGPGTFINESVRQLTKEFADQNRGAARRADRAAAAARKLGKAKGLPPAEIARLAKSARDLVNAEFTREIFRLALRYGLRSEPRIDDPNFVSKLVFDSSKPAGTPKARFAYLFPNKDSALIQVRLRPDLSDQQRSRAIEDIRAAVAMDDWKLEEGGTYTVTGAPVVVDDLAGTLGRSIALLLVAALLVMAATLALVFRAPLRLLPLAVALAAAALIFGGVALAGASLTMASIAVLPVLLGLAVDYAIQLQARTHEARRRLPSGDPIAAAETMAVTGAPTVATAAAATIAGFLVLLLSPVPMVQGFGLLLVAGIVLALGLALTAGTAATVLAARGRRDGPLPAPLDAIASAGRGARDLLAPPVRRAREALTPAARAARARVGTASGAVSRAALGAARRRPGRVLAVAGVIALAGWALDSQTRVESDIQRLVPQDLPALQDLQQLQRSTGVGGQLDVLVEADDIASPEVIAWMTDYQKRLVERYGYSADRGCGKAALCPAFSLPDLFRRAPTSDAQVRTLLDAVPAYFSQSVVTPDRRTATMSFGIKLMPLEEQKEVIDVMRRELAEDRPEGVRASLAGLPVLAAEANAQVSSHGRRLLSLVIGLLAVLAVLLVIFRDARRALVPLVPIVLATGWSAFVLFVLRIPLNPMSVTLGALVIAISTEFSVLLAERYRTERIAGHPPREALDRTYRSTGAAVLASGATAIAGFAVLVVSDIRMLREFGFVTVIDLTVSLLGVLVVLPAVLLLAERWDPAGVRGRLRLPARPGARREKIAA